MEPIGFAVGIAGLAGLFSVCLDVIDKVDSYKDFGVESRSIIAQFEADKHLFTKWAQDVGIDKDKIKNNHHSHLDNPKTNLIVRKILSSIQEIFIKTERTVSNLQPAVEFSSLIHVKNLKILEEISQRGAGLDGLLGAKQNSFTKLNNLEPWSKDCTAWSHQTG
jgi:hypothetical protein